jgi:hypothetical protein
MDGITHFAQTAKIEDPRGHSAETLQRLRQALVSGAPTSPDERRPGFFEVQADEQVFYVHISPVTHRVILLATWAHEPQLPELEEVAHSA